MKFFKSGLFSWLTSLIFLANSLCGEEFVTVEKRNVTHKFAKTGNDWVDNFTAKMFQNWEEETFNIFEIVHDKNGIAIDIGAWLGTTAIWLSNHFKHVVAIEADRESVLYLNKNLQASGCNNVKVCDRAITDKEEVVFFGPRNSGEVVFHGLEHSTVDSLNFSTSHVKKESTSKNDFPVSTITFNKLLKEYVSSDRVLKNSRVTFIKCDIEGGEEKILGEVLDYARQNNCKVWMSFHCNWWRDKKITDFKDQFAGFYATCPNSDVCAYIQRNPFASVLLIPK